MIRRRLSDLRDILIARACVWGLERLYDRCTPPYEPGCPSCLIGQTCDSLEELTLNIKETQS